MTRLSSLKAMNLDTPDLDTLLVYCPIGHWCGLACNAVAEQKDVVRCPICLAPVLRQEDDSD